MYNLFILIFYSFMNSDSVIEINDSGLSNGKITSCKRTNENNIVIRFKGLTDGIYEVEGIITLYSNEYKTGDGRWIYHDKLDGDEKFDAKISGTLDFNNDEIDFDGIWHDSDGEYDIFINAKIS
jgi:hypothetical protein